MSSHQRNMAQKFLNEFLQRYGIVAPATSTPSMQNTSVDIPQGIPALLEFSRRHTNTSALDRVMAKLSIARQYGSIPEVRLAGLACGLLYLSRSTICPILSSIGDEMNRELLEWIAPEPTTVSMTVAELQEMHDFADRVQVKLDEYKRIQSDMLTEFGNLDDEVDRLTQQAANDAAHSAARIRGLEDQLEVEQETAEERKVELDQLQAEYNDLEDDRDEWKEKAEDRQTGLDKMTAARNDLQASVGQMETEKAGLRAEIAALKEQLKAQGKDMHGTNEGKEESGAADGDRQDDQTNPQATPDEQDYTPDVQVETSEDSTAEAPADRKNTKRIFDEFYDVSDRGDNDGDTRDVSEGLDEDQGHEDDVPSYGQRIMSRMNASASEVVPSVRAKRPVPPILPHHQAYIASQQGYDFVVAPPELPVSSTQSPVRRSFAARSPYQPALEAARPHEARNPHVRDLNAAVMQKAWRRRSGMPDRDEEVTLAPEDELEIEGMFQRQIIQAYTPMLAFSTFPPSITDILDAPEMRAAAREIPSSASDAPRNDTTPPIPYLDSSDNTGADEEVGSEEEWSDDDDDEDDDDDNDNSMPMLGNYRVTRPKPSKKDAEEPMLGNHQVTLAPTPTNEDSEEPQVTLGQPPAGSESPGMPGREEEAADDGFSANLGEEAGDVGEAGGEDRERANKEEDKVDEEEEGSENDLQPSSPSPAPEPLPLAAGASNTSPPAIPQSSTPPGPASPRERQRPRRPSNYFPGEENATKTHDEEVGDLLAIYLTKHATMKLSDSRWANKLDDESQEMPLEASSSSSALPAEDEAPPRMPNVGLSQADQAPPRGPPTSNDGPKPQPPPGAPTGPRNGQASPAPPRGPSISNDGPKPQPPPSAPSGPRGHGPRDPAQDGLNEGANVQPAPFGRQPTNITSPPGSAGRNDSWSPRGNARRGYQPGQPGRRWTPEPPRTPPAIAGNNNNNSAYNQHPPAGPAGRRGGRGGRAPSTPQPGPSARRARSAAMESFRRQNLDKKDG